MGGSRKIDVVVGAFLFVGLISACILSEERLSRRLHDAEAKIWLAYEKGYRDGRNDSLKKGGL